MDTKEKYITRILRNKTNGKEIEAVEMFKSMHKHVFECSYLDRVQVIDIQTVYNDYKKLHDDLLELAKGWGKKTVCFSNSTDILDIVKMKYVRKVCKKERILRKQPLLNVSKICAGLLSFLNIIQIICSFIFGENYPLPSVIVLPILGMSLLLMIALAAQQTQKYNVELLEKLNSLNEDKLIDVYEKLVQKKSLLKEEGTYFIENFNKLDKNFRCYVIAYLKHKEYKKQIWCVFDYLFEDSLKIDSTEENVFYESFELVPLKYEEKEAIYKEYNLQRDIAKEYLNCIGVDILWGSKTDIVDGSFKFHSLDFIQGKIEEVRKKLDSDGSLTSVFYCLVYMSSKYKCSFSMAQMISLIQNEEIVNSLG